jgi:predicted ribosomally synthesized peptide with SipW-like signal peptide
MKNILLSVVVVATLVAAGVGGTLADFSDIEISEGNEFETGSMNLKVSDETGALYDGPGPIPAIFTVPAVAGAWPCCSKDIRFDLHLECQGQGTEAHGYIHFKGITCYGVEKVEPEIAVEQMGLIGEKADGTLVYSPLNSEYGENCELKEHIDIAIFKGPSLTGPWTPVDLSTCDTNGDGTIKMDEIECCQVYIGLLECGVPVYVMCTLHLQDVPEEDLGYDLFDETNWHEAKFNDWPTNALMKDGMRFNISFEATQAYFGP